MDRTHSQELFGRVSESLLVVTGLMALALPSCLLRAQQSAAAVVPSSPAPAPAVSGPFQDVTSQDWNQSAITILSAEGVMGAATPGHFNPQQLITRSEFASAAARLFNLAAPPHPVMFTDLPVDRAANSDVQAVAPFMDFTQANGAASFRPNDAYDSQHAAATLVRILSARGAIRILGDAGNVEPLARVRGTESINPELRGYVAAAERSGMFAHLKSVQPAAMLTRAQAAVLLEEVELSYHPLKLACPSSTAAPATQIEVSPATNANPSLADICRIRRAFSQGSVVSLAGGSGDQLSALLDRRFPTAAAGDLENKGPTRRITAKKAPGTPQPRLGADEGTVIRSGLVPTLLAVHLVNGVPHYFQGFAPSSRNALQLGAQGFQRWVAAERVAIVGAAPRMATRMENISPGQCSVATNNPANATLGNTWTCYAEFSVQAVSSTCDYPNINSCPPSGTYTLSADLLRQDENDSTADRYLVVAQWDTNMGTQPCNWNTMAFGEYTCGPYVTDRTVSMPLITLDTNPPAFPATPPPGGSTGAVSLVPGSGGHGPSSSLCSHSTGVTDTVGAGLSTGFSGSNATGSVSVTASQGYTQTWSCPDLTITDNTNNPSGSPNYPADTTSWVETFDPPSFYFGGAKGPGADAVSNFQGTSEAAVFSLPEDSSPTEMSVFGLAHSQLDDVTYFFGGVEALAVGETVNLSLNFTVQPPSFYACTWSVFILFGLGGGVCDSPATAGSTIPQLQVPLGPTGVSLGVFGQELQYGAPIAWTASAEQTTIVNVAPQEGPNNSNIVSLSQVQPGGCIAIDTCDVQITLSNPGTSGLQNATVEIPTATPGPNAVDGGPIAFTIVELTVVSVQPTSGPTTGGTSVTLNGSGFTGATDVTIRSTSLSPCSSANPPCFNVNSSGTQITFTTPPGAVGTVTITVTAADGAQTTAQFSYTAPPAAQVSAVSATVSPTSYTGSCPKIFTFDASITASAAGVVTYTWLRSDGATAPVESITFTAAGTKTVSTTWELSPASFNGWEQLKVLTPNLITSNQASFTLKCN